MSVTIIGCGWLGFPLGKELVNEGHLVHGSVRDTVKFEKLREVGIHPFQLDLELSTEVSTEIVESTKILIIAIPPLHRKEPKKYRNILTELLLQFPNETRVIFTSSTGIYPKVAGNFDEGFEFNLKQDSTVLNVSENAIRQSKKSHVIFRLGGLIGPNRHPIRFLQGRQNVKNPHGPINFVHQGDCIEAIRLAVAKAAFSGTFNLVYPDHPSRQNYYSDAAKHYGLSAPHFEESDAVDRRVSSEKILNDSSFKFKFRIDNFPKLKLN
ncbi:MAG: NAD(P)H-binding protein [Crocinitomicaceae bacterium]